jgi:aryl-alcohol dehydrogenase-like predicted oxidoreductase
MNYKNLGKSGLKVSSICLGSNNFGGQVNEEDSIKIIRKAVDLGINIIDTSNGYTDGRSEEIIGKAVQCFRDEVILATKVGWEREQTPNKFGLSRKNIRRQFKQSLKKLKTDFIDLYYLHKIDPNTPLEESLRTLNDLVREGSVNYIACSNFAAWQIAKANEICEKNDLEKFIAVEPQYNLLKREIEVELLPYCQNEGLGVLTYSPLMSGILTGKYKKNEPIPKGSRIEYSQYYRDFFKREDAFSILEKIENIAKEVDIPMGKLAIAWIMKNPAITAPIIGASKVEQVEENCRLTEINLSDEIYAKLNEVTKK